MLKSRENTALKDNRKELENERNYEIANRDWHGKQQVFIYVESLLKFTLEPKAESMIQSVNKQNKKK